jgi:hypothetical protein
LQPFFGEIGNIRHGLELIPRWGQVVVVFLPSLAGPKKRKPELNRAFFLGKDIKISRSRSLMAFERQ